MESLDRQAREETARLGGNTMLESILDKLWVGGRRSLDNAN